MKDKLNKIKYKLLDHMLIGSIYDTIMIKTKYRDTKMAFCYNVMIGQKHRLLYYKKLKKQFWNDAIRERSWEQLEKVHNSDTIWFCWLQGIENAPLIVKRCYESVCRISDKKVVLIDESNIFDYITLPDYIVDKWKTGTIGYAHFTDIARLALLNQHGGYWIDSTVLCTDDRMFKLIDSTDLFMYSFYYFGFNPEIMELNNWFIYSTTNNNILSLQYQLLLEYWKKYDRAVNYFFFHIFMTMCTEYYEEEYKKMPIISQVDAHLLATYIYDDFDSLKYELLCQQTGIHKLSTRFETDKLEKEGTFYDVVIRNNVLD